MISRHLILNYGNDTLHYISSDNLARPDIIYIWYFAHFLCYVKL